MEKISSHEPSGPLLFRSACLCYELKFHTPTAPHLVTSLPVQVWTRSIKMAFKNIEKNPRKQGAEHGK